MGGMKSSLGTGGMSCTLSSKMICPGLKPIGGSVVCLQLCAGRQNGSPGDRVGQLVVPVVGDQRLAGRLPEIVRLASVKIGLNIPLRSHEVVVVRRRL